MSSSSDPTSMPPPPPGSPPRAIITRTPSGSGASRSSPFTPRARKTALGRLPVHLLSFEDLSDDDEEGEVAVSASGSSSSNAPARSSPKAATAAALRTWDGDDSTSSSSTAANKGSGFNLSAEDFEFHSRIAEGAYGVVWRARLRPGWRRRGRRRSSSVVAAEAEGEGALEEGRVQEVAVKVQRVPPGEEDEQGQANLLIELSVLQGLVHPRLVRYHGAALLPEAAAWAREEWRPLLVPPGGQQPPAVGGGSKAAVVEPPLVIGAEEAKESGGAPAGEGEEAGGESSMLVLIAMEYCVRGSLRQALQQLQHQHQAPTTTPLLLPWALRVRIAADIAEGLAFLHEHGLLHRDLKTSNVLLDRGWRAKLCDHSFATAAHSPDLAAFTCGTDEFLAPEAALGEPPGYDKPCDVFSLGVVLCELITGKEPGKDGFLCRSARDLFQLDAEEVEATTPPECPASLRMLALHCAQNEPLDRPTAGEAQEWAASLLGELIGGEGAVVELPVCPSPLPWPVAASSSGTEKKEAEEGAPALPPVAAVSSSYGGGGHLKGRKVSWAQVAMRGVGRTAGSPPHGHKRALSSAASAPAPASASVVGGASPAAESSTGAAEPPKRLARDGEDGSRPLPAQHATLPGLLGAGSPGRAGRQGKGGKGKGGRGRRGGGGGGGGKGHNQGGGAGSRTAGTRTSPSQQQPQQKQASPQQAQPPSPPRIRGRVGSLDHSLSLTLTSSSLAGTGFARGRLGTPTCPLPSTFAAAVIGGDGGKAPAGGAVDELMQGVEGMRLASYAGKMAMPPLQDKDVPVAGQLAVAGWEQRIGQAQGRFHAQLKALRRELAAAEGSGSEERRAAVLKEVDALERVVKEDMRGAVAAVEEAVAGFRARVSSRG